MFRQTSQGEQMSEHDFRQSKEADAGTAVRSHLLTPIMEGKSQERNNITEFLAGRLSAVGEIDIRQLRSLLS